MSMPENSVRYLKLFAFLGGWTALRVTNDEINNFAVDNSTAIDNAAGAQ